MSRRSPWTLVAALLGLLVPGPGHAGGLMDLSLEELAAFKITSVSKQAQSLQGSAAAIYVITGEEMERSGYTSVAEALRMVPGVQVARVNAHDWDIGARGFNTGLGSNKLLVLIDGRSVYSPLFAGIFWELRDVPVEDIERIEVIRGPGAALWGANAVNGVINIITRPAAEAKGWTLRGGGGTEERAQGLIRYGGEFSEDARFRLTASGFQRDGGHARRGVPDDDWWLSRVQGRADWSVSDADQITANFEVFGAQLDQNRPRATPEDTDALPDREHGYRVGANGLLRWERDLGDDSDVAVQLWYEFTDFEFNILRELRHTIDLDAQHHFPLGDRQDLIWGAAYRFSYDEERERGNTTFDPRIRGVHLVTAFVQDQIQLWPERVRMTLGSKFEYNEFTGFEVQPSARLAWTPNEDHTLWTAVSRAVRTPTRLDADSDLGLGVLPPCISATCDDPMDNPFLQDPTVPTVLVLRGNSRFKGEDVLAVEGGYRVHPHADLSFDVAAFYNSYEDLATFEFGAPEPVAGPTPFRKLPFVLDNKLDGYSYGTEVAGWWQVKPWWRLHANYSFLKMNLDTDRGSLDGSQERQEGSSPEHQAFLRSSFDLPGDVLLDTMLRYVGRLRKGGAGGRSVDDYLEFDLRLAWRFCEGFELAFVGQNLLHDQHRESGTGGATGVQRGYYGTLRWRFGGEE